MEFVFENLDTIGVNAAEYDTEYLSECYVDMPELPVLKDIRDPRFLIVGRTGMGKTALFMRLAEEIENCHMIDADTKGFCFTERSTVLTDLTDKGLNLAPYLKLLWLHVLNIEVIQGVFPVDQKESVITRLRSLFSQRDAKEETALRYLEEHQDEFWMDTTEKTKKMSERFTRQLEGLKELEIRSGIGLENILSVGASSQSSTNTSASYSVQIDQEYEKRWLENISHDLASKIGSVPKVIDALLDNKSRIIYIAIDRIDESVIKDTFRYQSLRGLIDAILQLKRSVKNLKIVISVRSDLLDCIFKKVQNPGQQFEKYRSLFLQLRWDQPRLVELAERRLQKLVRKRYQPRAVVSLKEFFPEKIHVSNNLTVSFEDYMIQRTWDRPRDIIDFINLCINLARGNSSVTQEMVFKAEHRYSQEKYISLQDEWGKTIPEIGVLIKCLNGLQRDFSVADISDDRVMDWIIAVQKLGAVDGDLLVQANECEKSDGGFTEFRDSCLQLLYKAGVIGIKFSPSDTWMWSYKEDYTYENYSIQNRSQIKIHPGLWAYYGLC